MKQNLLKNGGVLEEVNLQRLLAQCDTMAFCQVGPSITDSTNAF